MTGPITNVSFPEFSEFYRAVHGFDAYRWQCRLAEQVLTTGRFPDLVDLPTGAGKTSIIDIAVYALGAQGKGVASGESRLPRRLVYVVDRRLILDQVNQHGRRLVQALQTARPRRDGGPVALVAAGLADQSAEGLGRWFQTAHLRGGAARDERWVSRPDVPTLITSTVDQVGSRLLFRGYGVRPRSLSVHAGLLSSDCWYFLDEVHLSRPFAETLGRIGQIRSAEAPGGPFGITALSATPSEDASTSVWRFPERSISSEDHDIDPGLRERLVARKPVRLVAASVTSPKSDRARHEADMAKALVREVTTHLKESAPRAIGVVCNRVATALEVTRQLNELSAKGSAPLQSTVLLTGRMRPVDRDAVVREQLPFFENRAERNHGEVRVLVSTQVIEAGVDLDLDCLVTECASSDALRQRFGRLDRAGALTASGSSASGSVVLRGKKADPDDPIYGPALGATWHWLNQVVDEGTQPDAAANRFDFGLELVPSPPVDSVVAPQHAPLLGLVELETLVQTSPLPAVDVDLGRYLHGPQPTEPEVQIAWRVEASGGELTDDTLVALGLCPLRQGELLAVPAYAARAWLAEDEPVPVGDVDGQSSPAPPPRQGAVRQRPRLRPFVRQRGEELSIHGGRENGSGGSNRRGSSRDVLQGGDTIIVPVGYGGIEFGTWNPRSAKEVADVAHQANAARGEVRLRVLDGVFPSALAPAEREADASPDASPAGDADRGGERPAPPVDITAEDSDPIEILGRYLTELATSPWLSAVERSWVEHLNGSSRLTVDLVGNGGHSLDGYYVVSSPARFGPGAEATAVLVDTGAPDDASSFTRPSSKVSLGQHLADVAETARRFAAAVGLPPELVDDVQLAARLHDLGKADVRFQQWIGWPTAGSGGEPGSLEDLAAKSGPANDRPNMAHAYPRGTRHELMSLALLRSQSALLDRANDPHLVEHLVVSHHGWVRPFAPIQLDDRPETVAVVLDGLRLEARSDHGLDSVGSGLADNFWRLVERYGAYGLAYLEAILRTADQTHSGLEAAGHRIGKTIDLAATAQSAQPQEVNT
jgi:CRISPR-associated endonuclease/helicase Cas3